LLRMYFQVSADERYCPRERFVNIGPIMNTQIRRQTNRAGKIRKALLTRNEKGSGLEMILFATSNPLRKKKNFTANEPE